MSLAKSNNLPNLKILIKRLLKKMEKKCHNFVTEVTSPVLIRLVVKIYEDALFSAYTVVTLSSALLGSGSQVSLMSEQFYRNLTGEGHLTEELPTTCLILTSAFKNKSTRIKVQALIIRPCFLNIIAIS